MIKGLGTLAVVIGSVYLSNRLEPEKFNSKFGSSSSPKRRSTTLPKRSPHTANHGPIMNPKTLEELKQWGNHISKTFGKKKLPPLTEHGTFTAFALTATAWGENPPRIERDAKSLAERGRLALQFVKDLKEDGFNSDDEIPESVQHLIRAKAQSYFFI
jgi:hypothetical protein